MKTLIIYQSRYGSTKQYAEWINGAIESDITEIGGVKQFDLSKYDIIILGTHFHASHIPMKQFIIDNWDKMCDKKIILFSASGSPAEPALKLVRKEIPGSILDNITYFPLGGRFESKQLSIGDKLMMLFGSAFAYMVNQKEMARAMRNDYDYVSKDNIKEITDKVEKWIGN